MLSMRMEEPETRNALKSDGRLEKATPRGLKSAAGNWESVNVSGVVLTGALLLTLAGQALAQGGGGSSGGPAATVKYFDFFVVKGGFIAFGLVALSVVTIALAIEHSLSIRRAAIIPPPAIARTRELIEDRKYLEAIKFTADDPSMIGYVLNACLMEASNGFTAMERALEEALEERAARLFRKIEYVNIIGNVAPMIGLLGTVTGMILLFAEIHAADTFPGARVVADKVAIALITTFWGLAVAIPALSIYAVFRNRIDVLTAECALAAEHILSVFKPPAAGEDRKVRQPPVLLEKEGVR